MLDAPLVKDNNPICGLLDIIKPMGGDQYGGSLRSSRANEVEHASSSFGIERSSRLVQQQHLGTSAEGQRQRETLLLTARKASPTPRRKLGEPTRGQH